MIASLKPKKMQTSLLKAIHPSRALKTPATFKRFEGRNRNVPVRIQKQKAVKITNALFLQCIDL
jgi:hypothetical protein